jgi:hypothetical protein
MKTMHHPADRRCGASLKKVDWMLFIGFIALLTTKALTDLDVNWDNLAYHLPFAALRSGIFGPEFSFDPYLTAVYQGFPPLLDVLEGYVWKITDNMNAGNLLNVVIFASYVILLHRFSRAPLIIIACAIAAIPLIHTQLATGYVDNLSNLSFGLAIVLTFIAATERRDDWLLLCGVAIGGLAFAANVKLQFVFLSSLALIPVALLFWVKYVRGEATHRIILFSAVVFLGVAAISWLPLHNALLYGNPLYPIEISLFGYHLPGVLSTARYGNPAYVQGYPQFVKWLLSVSEFHAFDLRTVAYNIDQGDTPQTAMSFRMGGYLFVYVLVSLGLFVLIVWEQNRRRLAILAAAGLLSAFVASLPASHELRYYSFWMVTLVSCVIYMLWADIKWVQLRVAYSLMCVGSFWFVASITGYDSLRPLGTTMSEVQKQIRFDEKIRPLIQPNGTYCLVDWGPYGIAAAPALHPELGHYRVRVSGLVNDCGDAVVIKLGCLPPWDPCNS